MELFWYREQAFSEKSFREQVRGWFCYEEFVILKGSPLAILFRLKHCHAVTVLASSLMLTVPGLMPSASGEDHPIHQTATNEQPTAPQLMQIAHDGRAEWENFPGFEVKLTLATDTAQGEGQLHVSRDGKMDLKLPPGEEFQWVERTLKSVVGHRIVQSPAITNVEFADNQTNHPHGRLLRSSNPEERSLWRVQGDVMTEVHRLTDTSRLVISIGDVWRTPENKHLPRNFAVTTWELPSNQIRSARQVHQDWIRIGDLDLPLEFWAITNRPDGTSTTQRIDFSEHKLLPPVSNVQTTSTH